MSYIESEKIKMFPVGNRADGINVEAAETTEKNITQILNSIYSKKNFVISGDKSAGNLELVLGGYYFNIVGDTTLSGLTGNLYAYVAINKANDVYNRLCKINSASSITTGILDDSNTFYGLCIDTSVPTSTTYDIESIQIFDSAGNIPKASKVHWTTAEILNTTSEAISEHLTTSSLDVTTSAITLSAGTTSESYPTLVTNDGTVLSRSLSSTTTISANKIISEISQDDSGKVTVSTTSITVSKGVTQGQVKVNGVGGSVFGLTASDSPTFSSVTADSFIGDLSGTASTAECFSELKHIELEGDVYGDVDTYFNDDAVITASISNRAVTAAKLAEKYNYIETTISGTTLTITITNNKSNS